MPKQMTKQKLLIALATEQNEYKHFQASIHEGPYLSLVEKYYPELPVAYDAVMDGTADDEVLDKVYDQIQKDMEQALAEFLKS